MSKSRYSLSLLVLCLAALLLGACAPRSYIILVTATPIPPTQLGEIPATLDGEATASTGTLSNPVGTQGPLPSAPVYAVTPNPTRVGLPDPVEQDLYLVRPGDTLRTIAESYGVTLEALQQANQLPDQNLLSVGQPLVIPLGVAYQGPADKLIPDSELVYGPRTGDLDVAAFVAAQPGYLKGHTEEVLGLTMTGAQIVDRVALETSVNPRLLLALLEYESGWLSRRPQNEFERIYPLNYTENGGRYAGLYQQLGWAANQLNAGYYGWRQGGLWAVALADGTRVAYGPTLNAGTVGVHTLLARTRNWDEWQHAVSYLGFWQTYYRLFGDPFQYNYDPILPSDLAQPEISFPWAPGEAWYYTGGPHGGWASGTAWAAIDFATGDIGQGCYVSESWARAVADGVIARSEPGIVVLDLDGDGFEGSGWTIFYLHIASEGRAVREGDEVKKGDAIGHPSCEGGYSNATHLHLARRYNGEWMSADCSQCLLTAPAPPFVMSGWTVFSFGVEYDGSLVSGDAYREARQARDPINELIYYE